MEEKYNELIKRKDIDLEQAFTSAINRRNLIDELQESGKYGTKTIK